MTAITSGNEYFTNSGLLLKFGTTKAEAALWSEYVSFGSNRLIEGFVDLTKLSGFGTTTILGDTEFFPAPSGAGQLYIEKVEVVCLTGATGSTATFSLGLISAKDRSTIPSGYGTAFLNAATQTNLATQGKILTYDASTTQAGGLIGSTTSATNGPFLITGLAGTANFTAGQLWIRIYYHGYGSITE